MNYFKVKVNGENFVVSITKVQNSAVARILLSKGDYEDTLAMCMKLKKGLKSKQQGAHYESTYNVNYKGEVGTQYLGFREKNSFYCPVSDKGSENCHQGMYSLKNQQVP